MRTFAHEIGHNIDYAAASNGIRYSGQQTWLKAMADDQTVSGDKSVTNYGENAPTEDFAEAIAEYVTNKAAFTSKYPNRTAILKGVFNL